MELSYTDVKYSRKLWFLVAIYRKGQMPTVLTYHEFITFA